MMRPNGPLTWFHPLLTSPYRKTDAPPPGKGRGSGKATAPQGSGRAETPAGAGKER